MPIETDRQADRRIGYLWRVMSFSMLYCIVIYLLYCITGKKSVEGYFIILQKNNIHVYSPFLVVNTEKRTKISNEQICLQRQTDRQTDRQAGRQTEKTHFEPHTRHSRVWQTDRQTDKHYHSIQCSSLRWAAKTCNKLSLIFVKFQQSEQQHCTSQLRYRVLRLMMMMMMCNDLMCT